MEVHLPSEVETKLVSLANQRGTNAHSLARAAIDRFVNFDAWFIREEEKAWGKSTGVKSSRTRALEHISKKSCGLNATSLVTAQLRGANECRSGCRGHRDRRGLALGPS